MKHLLILFSCLLLFSCVHEKKKDKSDLARYNYKGNVKLVTTVSGKYVEDMQGILKDSIKGKHVDSYNRDGFRVEQVSYKDDKIIYRVINKYDEKNNLIEQITFAPPQSDKYTSILYDSLIKHVDLITYKFDSKGNILETSGTRDGKPWYRYVNTLYKNGNVVVLKKYIAWVKGLNDFETYENDASGNRIETDWFKSDSTLIMKFTYKYDDNGNDINEVAYKHGDTLDWNEVKTYDDKGNVTRNIDYHKGTVVHWDWRYEYRKFDATGNWTEQVFYNMGKPETITERTIEYY